MRRNKGNSFVTRFRLFDVLGVAVVEFAVFERVGDRVERNRTLDFRRVYFVVLQIGYEQIQCLAERFGTIEVDGRRHRVDAFQQFRHLFHGLDVLGAEPHAFYAAFDGFGRQGVGRLDVAYVEVLTDFPIVAFGLLAAQIRELAGFALQVAQGFEVFATVVRFDVKAFAGFPNQLLFVVGSFQVFVNHFFPFLRADGRKFRKQFFVAHIGK